MVLCGLMHLYSGNPQICAHFSVKTLFRQTWMDKLIIIGPKYSKIKKFSVLFTNYHGLSTQQKKLPLSLDTAEHMFPVLKSCSIWWWVDSVTEN